MPAARSLAVALFAAAMVGQGAFWWSSRAVRVEPPVVAAAPSERAVHALSFGDTQFLFRALALEVQNMGDGGGRFTPLTHYDYAMLGRWFERLDALDARSDYTAALAGYYFSQSRDPEQLRHVVAYLRRHAARDPETKWRWLAHAAYIARHRIKDQRLALSVARELAALPVRDIPVWTKQMPAFVLADVGEDEAARDLMAVLLASAPNLSAEERLYMQEFIADRR